MYNKMIIKKILFPTSSTALLIASVSAAEEKKDEKKDEEKKELVRRKDLSIYPVKAEEKPKEEEKEPKPDSALHSAVKQVRETIWSMNKQIHDVSDAINHIIETGKAHTNSALQTLREEDNYPERAAAIVGGSFVGYIIAFRRGFIRRMLYTGIGAASVAAVVYPEEARELSSEGMRLTKKYIAIAYHFVNGDGNKQGNGNGKETKSSNPKKIKEENPEPQPEKIEPKPTSFVFPDPTPVDEKNTNYDYNMYSRRA